MAPKTQVPSVKPTVRIQRKSTPATAPGQELIDEPAAQLEPATAQQTPTSEAVLVKKECEE
eukprot:6335941-Amphidinium_carterae.1